MMNYTAVEMETGVSTSDKNSGFHSERSIYIDMQKVRQMEIVTLSPKFQVVIPAAVRKTLDMTPGQKLQVIVYRNRIEMIPLKPMQSLRGFLARIDQIALFG